MDPQTLANLSPQQQQMLMQKMQDEVASAQMQDLVQNVTEKCHKKCAGTSGSQLDKREQGCYSMCMDRYTDTMQAVTQALQARNNR
ncbi:hypothetical protein TrRE_jg10329 [Triparma retinervis]|uniref:Mitochondrial import inner membrane translocase subunit n=1 Tax=Triparma retinervis TaxID=2557542 RepID=A0A9W6ZEE2_9STRA|nr:hypothetical protein TrRE_jg10329 [Triparma retinervis]